MVAQLCGGRGGGYGIKLYVSERKKKNYGFAACAHSVMFITSQWSEAQNLEKRGPALRQTLLIQRYEYRFFDSLKMQFFVTRLRNMDSVP